MDLEPGPFKDLVVRCQRGGIVEVVFASGCGLAEGRMRLPAR